MTEHESCKARRFRVIEVAWYNAGNITPCVNRYAKVSLTLDAILGKAPALAVRECISINWSTRFTKRP